jgi:hypothetical protein
LSLAVSNFPSSYEVEKLGNVGCKASDEWLSNITIIFNLEFPVVATKARLPQFFRHVWAFVCIDFFDASYSTACANSDSSSD